ncbi:MAG: hypothetical protein U1E38_10545 [Rhodospirillales bacterium]
MGLPAAGLLIRAAPWGSASININFNAPRYAIIEGTLGSVGLDIAAAMDNIAAIGLLAVQAVGQSLFPRLADLWLAGDRSSFARLSLQYVAIAIAIALFGLAAAMLAGHWILGTALRRFIAAEPAFRFVMAAMIIAYVSYALGHIVTATGRFGPLVWPYVAVVGVTMGFAHLAVPVWGTASAAFAVAAGHAVGIVAITFLLLRFARAQREAAQRSASDGAVPAGRSRPPPVPWEARAIINNAARCGKAPSEIDAMNAAPPRSPCWSQPATARTP